MAGYIPRWYLSGYGRWSFIQVVTQPALINVVDAPINVTDQVKSPASDITSVTISDLSYSVMSLSCCVDVLSEQKRVRLIMQVFHSSDIVRDESIAVVKFRVWWHFVISLKDKAATLFSEV